jgi:hypothetical protein
MKRRFTATAAAAALSCGALLGTATVAHADPAGPPDGVEEDFDLRDLFPPDPVFPIVRETRNLYPPGPVFPIVRETRNFFPPVPIFPIVREIRNLYPPDPIFPPSQPQPE